MESRLTLVDPWPLFAIALILLWPGLRRLALWLWEHARIPMPD